MQELADAVLGKGGKTDEALFNAIDSYAKAGGRADVQTLADLNLPTLANTPDITVEILPSGSDPGGVSELAVPPTAPAIANALQTATGTRFRRLPLLSDAE